MLKHLIALLVLSTALTAQNSALYPDITILSSDAAGITFEYRPQYGADRRVKQEQTQYVQPDVLHTSAAPGNSAGAPDLRVRTVMLAVPGLSGHAASIVASDFETVTSYDLAPVPMVSIDGETGTASLHYSFKTGAGISGIKQPMVTMEEPAMIKGIPVASVVIAPFEYDAATRTLRKYSRIVVRVDFGTERTASDAAGDRSWAAASLLNFRTLAAWQSVRRMARTSAVSSVLASGTWVKLEVTEDGIYKLDAAYLRSIGIDPVNKPITDVKVFGGEGRNIPESLTAQRPADLPQIAVEYADKNGNGTFDTDDFILFYGQGVNGWNYDPVQKQFSHYGNPYTYSNYYFVASGTTAPVKSMASVSVTGSGSTVKVVTGKAVFDEDRYNFNQSGQDWVSAPINPGDSRTVTTKLTGQVAGTSVTYQYSVYGRSTDATSMSVDESGLSLGTASFISVDFSGYHYYAWPATGSATIVPTLSDQRSMVKFRYNSTSNISTGFIGWLRIFYRQQLTASGNQLMFASPDTSGTVSFALDGFSRNDVTVYEVSQFFGVRKIAYQLQQVTGSLVMHDTMTAGSVREYVACTPDQFKSPRSAVKIPNSNLHGFNGAEFIIITHSEFKSEAQRLKQHKESLPAGKRLSTIVVDVDTLYNEFGLGMPDPTAMRDFIRYAAEQWTVKPKYVLFFGDASYDYKGILKIDRNWVPTYQTPESNIKISSYAIEDYFSYLNPAAATTVAIAHGRLTPRSITDAKVIVDKIIKYETSMPKGTWRNMVTLVADDMWTPQTQNESDHIVQTETITQIALARGFDVRRIYMEEYPTVFASTGRRKPSVREDMLDMVNNRGTLLLNFVGHGNPKVWAHENVLTQDDVRNHFQNRDRLPFIVAATCDWGRFEEAGESSSAEDVVNNVNGGAIGVLSANRAVYSSENAITNQRFYEYMMSGAPMLRLGDAYLLMKNSMSSFFYLENKQKYFLLGDPTMALAAPAGTVTIDSLSASTGAAADTLKALEKITISAAVRDTANGVVGSFTGTAILTVNDAEFRRYVTPVPGFSYDENGAVIYSGQASIVNGRMTATFIVPKDISYTNKKGRVSVYFSNEVTDGRGYDRSFIVGGTNAAAPADSAGPEITIYFDDPDFRSGDLVSENPVLYVALKDSNGINSSTHSIGHRLEAWIDGSTKSIDLTGYYLGKTDSYKEGTATYALEGVSEGRHTISVRAWDVYNNSSTAEASFVVASGAALSIQQLFNIPNPVSTVTAFTFQHNQSAPVDVTIHIYTVAGRKVHTIERFALPDRFVKIDWDRRDGEGSEVGNGVYFYKVIAKTIDGRFTSEAIGKMAVIR